MSHLVIPYTNWWHRPDFNEILNAYVKENENNVRFINLFQIRKKKKENKDFFFAKNANELEKIIFDIEKEKNNGVMIISLEGALEKERYPIKRFSVCEKEANGKFRRSTNGDILLNKLEELDFVYIPAKESPNFVAFLFPLYGLVFLDLILEPTLVVLLTTLAFGIIACGCVSDAPYRTSNALVVYRYICAFLPLVIGITFCSTGFGVFPGAFLISLGSLLLFGAIYGHYEIQKPYVDYKYSYSIKELDIIDQNVISGTIYSPDHILQQENINIPSSSNLTSSDNIAESSSRNLASSTITHRRGTNTKSENEGDNYESNLNPAQLGTL